MLACGLNRVSSNAPRAPVGGHVFELNVNPTLEVFATPLKKRPDDPSGMKVIDPTQQAATGCGYCSALFNLPGGPRWGMTDVPLSSRQPELQQPPMSASIWRPRPMHHPCRLRPMELQTR